jgi:hypothetical protein
MVGIVPGRGRAWVSPRRVCEATRAIRQVEIVGVAKQDAGTAARIRGQGGSDRGPAGGVCGRRGWGGCHGDAAVVATRLPRGLVATGAWKLRPGPGAPCGCGTRPGVAWPALWHWARGLKRVVAAKRRCANRALSQSALLKQSAKRDLLAGSALWALRTWPRGSGSRMGHGRRWHMVVVGGGGHCWGRVTVGVGHGRDVARAMIGDGPVMGGGHCRR